MGLLFDENDAISKAKNILAQRFLIPPFTVLNARTRWWQNRKQAWVSLGIQSELGRGGNLLKMSDTILDQCYNDEAAHARRNNLAKTYQPGGPSDLAAQYATQDRKVNPGGSGNSKSSVYLLKTEKGFKSRKDPEKYQESANLGGMAHRISIGAYRSPEAETSAASGSGTSIFDPVLCELLYYWFSPPGGSVLDPFAGGSVRGVVAGWLQRYYQGVDLSAAQIDANVQQAIKLFSADPEYAPLWHCGDSNQIGEMFAGEQFDFVFSCPPYHDLEVYSDDKRDLSNLDWYQFEAKYQSIITQTCKLLKDNRFACFVVGDVRTKQGARGYKGLPQLTIECFAKAGLVYYNEAVLVTATGSLPLRVQKSFVGSRKLGKTHQNVLIFVKGSPEKASEACGEVEVSADIVE